MPQTGMKKLYEDRLVVRWLRADKRIVVQPKRVGKDCPIEKEVRHIYAHKGEIDAIKKLRETMSLYDAWRLMQTARGFKTKPFMAR